MRIEVICGNIVAQPDVDAIVNSANANLRFGSGVAGAIHTAAGPDLEAHCQPFATLSLGGALITPGFKLPNKWVSHVRSAHYLNDDSRYQSFESARRWPVDHSSCQSKNPMFPIAAFGLSKLDWATPHLDGNLKKRFRSLKDGHFVPR